MEVRKLMVQRLNENAKGHTLNANTRRVPARKVGVVVYPSSAEDRVRNVLKKLIKPPAVGLGVHRNVERTMDRTLLGNASVGITSAG
jgi:hypothetical protein